MDNQSKKTKLIVIGLSVLVIMVIAVSFAFFSYTKIGQNNLVTTGGGLSFTYTGEEALTLLNQFPKDAQTAISESDRFDFTITGSVPSGTDAINYKIYARAGNKPDDKEGLEGRFKDSEINLYLSTTAERDVTIEQDYGNELTGGVAGNSEEGFLLASGIINSGTLVVSYDFSLTMWINETVTISDTEPDATYCAHENIPTTEDDEGMTCTSGKPVYSNLYYSLIIEVQDDNNIQSTDKSLKNKILSKAYQGESSEKEIIAINNSGDKCEDLESCADNVREYRYSGPEVNNYIYLTDNQGENEKWRIIGIFTDEDTKEAYIKVIRDEIISADYLPDTYKGNGQTFKIKYSEYKAYWNNLTGTSSNKNNWPTAGLQYYLNGEEDSDSTKGYLSYLSSATKALLKTDVKHYLGSIDYKTDNARTAYEHERDVESCPVGKGNKSSGIHTGCNVWDGNDATWTGTVGLMYPSDFGYSAISDNWGKVFYGSSGFSDSAIKSTSWMYSTMTDAQINDSWTISPSSDYNSSVIFWLAYGNLNSINVSYYIGVRPVLNLKSETTWISGEGTADSPYVVVGN